MACTNIRNYWRQIKNFIESCIRHFIVFLTNFLSVKIIRDDKGRPFLYRYHLFAWTINGPGMCIHHFVKSDPDRGYHDHPWTKSMSFLLCGRYEERILNDDKITYNTYMRNRWTFNYLDGKKTYHRVMLREGEDVWTIFAFKKRDKIWGMVSLEGNYNPMSTTIDDQDGGWWDEVGKGLSVHSHIEHSGKVIAMVDMVIIAERKVLLIKRGKEPFKDMWAFPGGRIERKDTDVLAAAYRELKEETNLSGVKLEYIKTIGNAKRDPRGFCITNVFIGKLEQIPDTSYKSQTIRAGDDAIDYEWFDLDNLPDMAFDHKDILIGEKNNFRSVYQ